MTRILFAGALFSCGVFVTAFAERAESKEFSNTQFWNVPAIRYTNPKDDCLAEVQRWAKDNVQFECRNFFTKQPTSAALCERADLSFNDSDSTDKYGSECQTTATMTVN